MVERTVAVSGTGEAELAKLIENTFRHVNIALVNELAMFAGDLGVDIWEAIDAAATKPFGFMRFSPGPGVGGHCLPDRPELPLLAGEAALRVVLPLRRARQRRQREHAGLRGAAARAGLQPKGTSDPGLSCAAPRSCLQGEHQRRARVTVARARRRACSRSAPRCVRLIPTSRRVSSIRGSSSVDLCEEEVAAADAVVLLTDHDAFDYALVVAHAPTCSTPVDAWSGDQVERL